jgi:hypothetical protein
MLANLPEKTGKTPAWWGGSGSPTGPPARPMPSALPGSRRSTGSDPSRRGPRRARPGGSSPGSSRGSARALPRSPARRRSRPPGDDDPRSGMRAPSSAHLWGSGMRSRRARWAGDSPARGWTFSAAARAVRSSRAARGLPRTRFQAPSEEFRIGDGRAIDVRRDAAGVAVPLLRQQVGGARPLRGRGRGLGLVRVVLPPSGVELGEELKAAHPVRRRVVQLEPERCLAAR